MRAWPYLTWRIVYTSLLGWCSVFYFADPRNELGVEPGYALLLCGVLPSLMLLLIVWHWPMVARRCALAYGYLLLLCALVLSMIAEGFLWALVALPLIGFPIEALLISITTARRLS